MKHENASINVSVSLFTDYGVLLNTGHLQKNSPNPWIQSIYNVYLQVCTYLIFFFFLNSLLPFLATLSLTDFTHLKGGAVWNRVGNVKPKCLDKS